MPTNHEILDNLFNNNEKTKKKSVLQVSMTSLERVNGLKDKFGLTTYAMADTIIELGCNLLEQEIKNRK